MMLKSLRKHLKTHLLSFTSDLEHLKNWPPSCPPFLVPLDPPLGYFGKNLEFIVPLTPP